MHLSLSRLFSLSFWLRVFQSVAMTYQRFPLAIISLLILNFALINMANGIHLIPRPYLMYLFFFGLGGVFWLTATTLLKESLNWNLTKYYLLALPVLFIFFWYISTFDKLNTNSNPQLLIFAAGLCITFAAWLFRSNDNPSFWYFNYQLISASFFALLSTVILCGGLSLILLSMGYLFEINIFSKMYSNIWIFGISFLSPTYFLVNIPTQFDYQRSECQFPKGINFILSTILVPLTLIYMVILYAYFIKIIVQWELPQGHLGKMISIFGIIGIFTHLSIYPVYDRNSAILSWFYRYFYQIMIIPVLLLALAIGQRIYQYGVTETRYMVVICTLWFAYLIFHHLKHKQTFYLKQVPLSLALLLFFSSFGPWGIYQLPVNSQYSRLKTLLIKNKLLVKGIITVKQQPPLDSQIGISSMVDYLFKHSAEQKLRPWFDDKEAFDTLVSDTDLEPFEKHSGGDIVELMGIYYISRWQQRNQSDGHSTKTVDSQFNKQSYSVTNYDVFIPIEWLNSDHSRNVSFKLSKESDKVTNLLLSISGQGNLVLTSSEGEAELLSFDLENFINQFTGFHTQLTAGETEKMIIRQADGRFEGKLYIHHLVRDKTDGKIQFRNLSGGLLIKIHD